VRSPFGDREEARVVRTSAARLCGLWQLESIAEVRIFVAFFAQNAADGGA